MSAIPRIPCPTTKGGGSGFGEGGNRGGDPGAGTPRKVAGVHIYATFFVAGAGTIVTHTDGPV